MFVLFGELLTYAGCSCSCTGKEEAGVVQDVFGFLINPVTEKWGYQYNKAEWLENMGGIGEYFGYVSGIYDPETVVGAPAKPPLPPAMKDHVKEHAKDSQNFAGFGFS